MTEPRDDGQDVKCSCDMCIYGDRVNPVDVPTAIYLCYDAGSDNYMKVRGEDFCCPDGESE